MATKKTNSLPRHVILAVLIGINIIISIIAVAKPDGAMKLEELRAWWPENFEQILEFYQTDEYKQQQTQGIEQALGQTNNNPNPTTDTTPTNPTQNDSTPTTTADSSLQESIEQIVDEWYMYGNADARYTVIEYSDLECPFCKRHHQNGTLKQLVDQNPEDVNHVFRHFPLNNIHPNAQLAGEAAECAGDLEGSDAFFSYVDEVFKLQSINRAWLVQAANAVGVNEWDFEECLDSGNFTSTVASQLSEGQSLFWVSWTPGNVLVDTETGRFVLIAGAYPLDRFIQELENMKNNE